MRNYIVVTVGLAVFAACGEGELTARLSGETSDVDSALVFSTRYEAESFALSADHGRVVEDTSASAGRALLIWSNGAAKTTFSSAGQLTQVTVRARGAQCFGAPRLRVLIDGTEVLAVGVTAKTWTEYTAAVSAPAGSHSLSVAFLNDYRSGCDRNLFVDRVTFAAESVSTGASLEAEKMTFPAGMGKVFADTTASAQQGALIWSNSAVTALHRTSNVGRMIVRARGDLCGGAPQMTVKVDGAELLSVAVNTTGWSDYSFDAPLEDGVHRIDVGFTNDASTSSCDRNLRIDKLSFVPPGCEQEDAPVKYTITGKKIHLAPKPLGDDATGDGSLAKPFFSLNRAASVVAPGDGIVLANGTYAYTKQAILKLNGTSTAPIVIASATGAKPVIDGSQAWYPRSHSGLLFFEASSYVIVDGLEIKNSKEAGLAITESHHITVQRSFIHHARYQAVRAGGTDLKFINNELAYSVLSNADAILEPNNGGWAAGVSSWPRDDGTSSRRISWINNDIHDHWGECLIGFFVDEAVIRGNRIRNCFSASLYLDHAQRVRVDRNVISQTTDRYNRNGGATRAHGIALGGEYYRDRVLTPNEDIVISNNLVVGTQNGVRFWNDGRNTSADNTYRNLRIVHNVFANMQRVPVGFPKLLATAALPRDCILAGNVIIAAPGINAVEIGNAGGWKFNNNVFPNGVPAVANEPGTFAANPLFKSPYISSGPLGFRPQAGSPLLGATSLSSDAPRDFWCAPRSLGTSVGIADRQQ